MAVADVPVGEAAPAAPAEPRTPTPSSSPAPEKTEPQAAASSSTEETQAAEPDIWGKVTELDADELLEKHPRLAKRLGALADKQARQRVESERERLNREAQEAAERRKQDLFQRAEQGDPDAEAELLDLTKKELAGKYGQQVVQEQLSKAEEAARARVWEQHAKSFGLDPDDPDVSEVLGEAKDFKSLNRALLAIAKDNDAVEAMWSHPEIQKRHKAALETAKAAATINGQASVIGDKKLDLSASGGGRPQTADEVIAEYASVFQRGQKPSAELTEAYRRAVGRKAA